MKITDIEIRLCKHQEEVLGANELRDSHKSELHFLMVTLKTDAGVAWRQHGFRRHGGGDGGHDRGAVAETILPGQGPLCARAALARLPPL